MNLSALGQDCQTAARRLRRAPWHSALVVFTLALGLGAHAAVSRVASVVLYPHHAFIDGSRVVSVELYKRGSYAPVLESHAAALASQEAWFERMETVRPAQQLWRTGTAAKRVSAAFVTPTLPSRIGANVLLGRGFLVNEGGPADQPVVLITERLWRRDLAGAPDVVGTTMMLGDARRTVIGVVTSTTMYSRVDAWIPTPLARGGTQRVNAVAWLRPDAARDGGTVSMPGRAMGLEGSDADLEVRLVRPAQRTGSTVGRVLVLLWAASGFVLAIICANLSTLLVARNLSRQRELSVCAALGAGQTRIVRPLVLEGLFLGVAGGVFGVFVADWCIRTLLSLRPRSLSLLYPDSLPVDASLVVYTVALASVLGTVIGTLAMVRWTRSDLIRAAGREEAIVVRRHGVRRFLAGAVMVETALAVIVALGAILMLTSFLRLRSANPGFEPGRLAELAFELDGPRYRDAAVRRAVFQDVAARIARVDGIAETTVASDAPPHSVVMSGEIDVDGRPPGSLPPVEASWVHVAPNYFAVLRIPILGGRTFGNDDDKSSVIVSESFARRYWGTGANAVGQRFQLPRPNGTRPSFHVVGVAGNVFGRGFRDQDDEIYLPYSAATGQRGSVLARTAGDPARFVPLMKAQLWSVDPDVPDSKAATLTASMAASIDEQPFYSALFAFFAIVAVLLAALGIFAVAAHGVASRRVEFAVHLALGAQRSEIERMVLRQGAVASLVGTIVGLAGALALAGAMRSVIRDVRATDPWTYVSVAAAFGIVSLAAVWLPAHRAARVDPASLLRR